MIITNLVITAYCACTICCGKNASGLAANGKKPIEGTTIAVSRSIPFGTKVTISGHDYVVQDRLARRYDSRIDIYFQSHKAARAFGIKTNVVILHINK